MLQLLEYVTAGCRGCVGSRKSPRRQVIAQVVYSARQLLRGCAERRPNVVEVELLTAFCSCSNECNPKAASPVPEQIRQAGGPVVLFGLQLRVGQDIDRHEKEAVPKPWNTRANA